MGITRINHFTAKPGVEKNLHAFLSSVIATIANCHGCISCKLLQGAEDPSQLAIIEEWESIESHKAAASAIPPEKLSEAMSMFAEPPVGIYYRA